MRTLRLVVAMVLGIALPLAAQLVDRRRLDAEQRARAWNVATWATALYAFSALSMLGWMWVTRGGFRGRSAWRRDPLGSAWAALRALGLGLVSTAALVAALVAADAAVASALGLGDDAP